VQFETIHPFLDGNGRVGRLLITLLLSEGKILREPLLYLSLYFKNHRQTYYELLNSVRLQGDWEAWLHFFAEAVLETSSQAVETGERIVELLERDRREIAALGRSTASAEEVHRALRIHPIATSGWLVNQTGLTPATVNKTLERLVGLGILRELTGQKRNRVFGYVDYIALLNLGID
jgi:Fic family protein